MATQLSHKQTQFESDIPSIILVCDGVDSPANIGALFRTCDALGVTEILFCGTTIDTASSRLKRTARSTTKNTPFKDGLDIDELLTSFAKKNTRIIALELTDDSIPVENYTLDKTETTVLVIGNEKNGISPTALSLSTPCVHIQMLGKNSSMNVVQATAIALFALTKL